MTGTLFAPAENEFEVIIHHRSHCHRLSSSLSSLLVVTGILPRTIWPGCGTILFWKCGGKCGNFWARYHSAQVHTSILIGMASSALGSPVNNQSFFMFFFCWQFDFNGRAKECEWRQSGFQKQNRMESYAMNWFMSWMYKFLWAIISNI